MANELNKYTAPFSFPSSPFLERHTLHCRTLTVESSTMRERPLHSIICWVESRSRALWFILKIQDVRRFANNGDRRTEDFLNQTMEHISNGCGIRPRIGAYYCCSTCSKDDL